MGIGEHDGLLGKVFEMGSAQRPRNGFRIRSERFPEIGAGIPQAHIIRHHDDDIGLGRSRFSRLADRAEREEDWRRLERLVARVERKSLRSLNFDETRELAGLYRQALEITKAAVGEAHPSSAIRLNNLAGVLVAQGKREEAVPMYEEALRVFEAALPADHPNIAVVKGHLASLNAGN